MPFYSNYDCNKKEWNRSIKIGMDYLPNKKVDWAAIKFGVLKATVNIISMLDLQWLPIE